MVEDRHSLLVARIILLTLIGVSSAAFVVAICSAIIGCCNQRRRTNHPASCVENSTLEFMPAHKYRKDVELVGEDGTCAVCLSEFEDGEELRTLPECMHSFHVPCIDMWLYSHSNCPMCRTPQILRRLPDCGSDGRQTQHESRVLLDIPVPSHTV